MGDAIIPRPLRGACATTCFHRSASSRKGQPMAGRKVTRDDLRQAAETYKNWGKWGPDDEIGTLNYTSPEDIIAAARLVKKGKVISLALNFDNNGPQGGKTNYPALGRINPLHTMLRTGTDAYSGVLDKRGIRAADDMVVMPLQCGTNGTDSATCSMKTTCGTATTVARYRRSAPRNAASKR